MNDSFPVAVHDEIARSRYLHDAVYFNFINGLVHALVKGDTSEEGLRAAVRLAIEIYQQKYFTRA